MQHVQNTSTSFADFIGGPLASTSVLALQSKRVRPVMCCVSHPASPRPTQQALEVLRGAAGVSIIDDRAANRFPTPLDASHGDDVIVGRVRRDISRPDARGLDLFVCGDQIRKGAALNAVQIAELLL